MKTRDKRFRVVRVGELWIVIAGVGGILLDEIGYRTAGTVSELCIVPGIFIVTLCFIWGLLYPDKQGSSRL